MTEKTSRLTIQRMLVIREKEKNDKNDSDKGVSPIKKFLSSEVLILPVITIFIYGFAFMEKYHYLISFNIPVSLINIEVADIGMVILHLVTIYIYFFWIGFLVFVIINRWIPIKKDRSYIIFLSVMVSPIGYWLSLLIVQNRMVAIILSIPFCIIIGLLICWPFCVLTQSLEIKRLNVEVVLPILNIKINNRSLYESFVSGFNRNLLFFLSFVTLGSTYMTMGSIDARTRVVYPIAKTNPECVVAYQSSDRFICFSFDRAKKEIGDYRILFFQDSQNINFTHESIGPLHLKPTPTPTLKPTFTPTITKTPSPTATLTSTAEIPRIKD